MTDLLDLDRKLILAAQEGLGVDLSADEVRLMEKFGVGDALRLASLPLSFPGKRSARGGARQTSVYFVRMGERGPIKIGQTNKVRRRFAALQTASPHQLELLALTVEYDEIELHYFYAPERIRGEWFRPSPRLLAFIESLR